MRHMSLACFGCGVLTVMAGCGSAPDTAEAVPAGQVSRPQSEPAHSERRPGGLAVLDLDAVAQRLGRDAWLEDETRKKEKALNEQLAVVQQSFTEQMERRRSEAGDLLTREQRQELQAEQARLAQQLQQVRQQGQAELLAFRQGLIEQFREEVRPTARQVAAERGLSIVIPKDAHLVLSVEPDAEITDAVADRLATGSATAGPPGVERVSEAGGDMERR